MALTTFLFGNKYTLRKPPPRRSKMLGQNVDFFNQYLENVIPESQLTFHLDSYKLTFEKNNWLLTNSDNKNMALSNHKSDYTKQKEINNFLRIKIDILINMLTQLSAEYQLQEKEYRKLKKCI